MKSRFTFIAVTISLLLFSGIGICQEKASLSDWSEKAGQGNINWSAGYVEAVGIGAPPEKLAGKINARPIALHEAKENALRNLLEIIKNVPVDSTKSVRDFTAGNNIIDAQVNSLLKDAELVDYQYMPDGKAEVKLRMPLYGKLAQTIMSLVMTKPPAGSVLNEVLAQAVKELAPASPSPSVIYTGLVVDARGIQARPALLLNILDEDGKEVYGLSSVDLEYAIKEGMSGYSNDFITAQNSQRVSANPITVRALRSSGSGKSDLILNNADAQKVRSLQENAPFLKKCKVIIVLD